MLIAPTVSPPYIYTPCPMCEQIIRITHRVGPDGLMEYVPEANHDGIRIHLLYGCEAVAR